jgi:hypothetical protein
MKTVSLELAKQLKEAGYLQDDTYMKWYEEDGQYFIENDRLADEFFTGHQILICVAPTADEILDRLPERIDENHIIEIGPSFGGGWSVNYGYTFEGSDTLANALAMMWLSLNKNKL